jgi:TolB protein
MICSRYRFIRAAASGVAAELAAAIIASCSEKSTEPQPVEKSLKIAFESDRDGNEEIYVMNRDGTNQKRLTNNPGRDGSFSWSPDGSKISFVSERDGVIGIYVMDADGTGLDSLAHGTWIWRNTIWSPRDDAIAFWRSTPYYPQYSDICVFGPRTWAELTSDASRNYNQGWSPDGSMLDFVSNRDGISEIYVMDPDGSNQTRLTHSAGGSFGAMWSAWTPDGSKMVFASDETGNFEIYIMGFTVTRLTDNDAFDGYPSCAMSP